MSGNAPSANPLSYGGVLPNFPPNTIQAQRDPTSTDINANLCDIWRNFGVFPARFWILADLLANRATWVLISGGTGLVASISDTTDTPVFPSSSMALPPSNIQLVGTGGQINIVSNPASNLLTFSLAAEVLMSLMPDVGADVAPTGGVISITGTNTGAGSSTPDNNFETFNAGTSALQIAHRYQGAATTSDGGGQTQMILSVPVTVASVINISCQLAGIEATPLGVGGEITGTVFRGGGGATLLGVPDKVVRASAAIAAATFDVSVSGNNLIVTVTGVATHTIEWYIIAELVEKTFI